MLLPGASCATRGETMADDTSKRGPRDRSQINLDQDYEVRYWTETLGCTKEELKAAVAKVGTSVERVREHLRPQKHGTMKA
jgi:uncharacterized protein DUF3606